MPGPFSGNGGEPSGDLELHTLREELRQAKAQMAAIQNTLSSRGLMQAGELVDTLLYNLQAAQQGNPTARQNLIQLRGVLKQILGLGSDDAEQGKGPLWTPTRLNG